jgi:hypothetical protein
MTSTNGMSASPHKLIVRKYLIAKDKDDISEANIAEILLPPEDTVVQLFEGIYCCCVGPVHHL